MRATSSTELYDAYILYLTECPYSGALETHSTILVCGKACPSRTVNIPKSVSRVNFFMVNTSTRTTWLTWNDERIEGFGVESKKRRTE